MNNHIDRAYKLLNSLTGINRGVERPSEPRKPREPQPTISAWENLFGDLWTSSYRLSELVDEALTRAGLDYERIPAEMREALKLASVEAYQDSHDDSPYLKMDWETITPNEEYAAEQAVYLKEMVAYEKKCEEFLEKVEAYVTEINASRKLDEDTRDKAEFERLLAKFGKKG